MQSFFTGIICPLLTLGNFKFEVLSFFSHFLLIRDNLHKKKVSKQNPGLVIEQCCPSRDEEL
jgi:hypothetical protein